MNTMLKTAIFAAALLMLGGCATKALTPEEQAFQNAQNSCTEQTNSMIGGSRYSWGNELSWSNYFGGCQLNNDAISFQLPLTWNLAKSAIVRSTISRVLDTTIDFLLKRANQCLCLPLFCSRYTVCDLL